MPSSPLHHLPRVFRKRVYFWKFQVQLLPANKLRTHRLALPTMVIQEDALRKNRSINEEVERLRSQYQLVIQFWEASCYDLPTDEELYSEADYSLSYVHEFLPPSEAVINLQLLNWIREGACRELMLYSKLVGACRGTLLGERHPLTSVKDTVGVVQSMAVLAALIIDDCRTNEAIREEAEGMLDDGISLDERRFYTILKRLRISDLIPGKPCPT